MLGSIIFLALCFSAVFFFVRGCAAAQESREVRTYVTSADSTLSDSVNSGREELQVALASATEDPANVDAAAVDRAAQVSRRSYLDALNNEEIPPGFENAHHYVVTALGIRADATERLAGAAKGDPNGFGEALSTAVEDFKLSDALVAERYIPASEEALTSTDRGGDRNYLYHPEPFMDYEVLDLQAQREEGAAPADPNVLHEMSVYGVEVGGQQLLAGGNVVLPGSDDPVFIVAVTNTGEAAETAVPVEVVLETAAGRQARSGEIERIDPGATVTVEVAGFGPGALDETAPASVKVGPVEYESDVSNNNFSGTVTFGA